MKPALELKFKTPKKSRDDHYNLPRKTMDKVFSKIDGKNGNAIKLYVVLLGTKEGFHPSLKWIHDRTGMGKTSYYRARDYLVQQGLLEVTDKELIIVL